MPVSLSKGGNVSLSKEAPGLTALTIGLGWNARVTDGAAFDLDAVVFMCGEDGKVLTDQHFVFYGNKVSPESSVQHMGDNQTGAGDGDDETVKIDLGKVPAEVKKMVFGVTIHEAEGRKQSFGQVDGAYMRALNSSDNAELAKYDLSEDYSTETALIFGEVYRNGAEWKMKAVGAGFAGGLAPLAKAHGVNI